MYGAPQQCERLLHIGVLILTLKCDVVPLTPHDPWQGKPMERHAVPHGIASGRVQCRNGHDGNNEPYWKSGSYPNARQFASGRWNAIMRFVT
jgi:hypothetical protein